MSFNERHYRLTEEGKVLANALDLFLKREIPEQCRLQLVQYRDDIHALLGCLRPFQIGVMGMVSAGKSRLLNTLLGTTFPNSMPPDGLLRMGNGRTTAVPFEITFSLSFRAEIHFVDLDEAKTMIKNYAHALKRDDDVTSLRTRLGGIFKKFPQSIDDSQPYEAWASDGEESPFDYLGRGSIEFQATTPAELFNLIRNFVTLPEQDERQAFMAAVVNRVCLYGPFENLPAGVTLVDTPGLGDFVAMNPERTQALYYTLNESWYLSTLGNNFAHKADMTSLRSALMRGRTRVVMTQCGFETPRNPDLVRRQLMVAIAGAQVAAMTPQQLELWNSQKADAEKLVREIPVAFTELSQSNRDGIDTLKTWLRELGQEREVVLSNGEIQLGLLKQQILLLGAGQPRVNVDVDAISEWRNQFLGELRAIVSDTAYAGCFDAACYGGDWYGNQNSVKAAVRRNGGPHTSANGFVYDLNRDIAFQWYQVTYRERIDRIAAVRRNEQALRVLLGRWPVPQIQVILTAFSDRSNDVVNQLNIVANIEGRIRGRSQMLNVYPEPRMYFERAAGKNVSCHKRDEFNEIFNDLRIDLYTQVQSMERLVEIFHNRICALAAPVSPFPEAEALLGLVAAAGGVEELTCPISFDVLVNPVQLVPCGHIFSEANIQQWVETGVRSCPVCRSSIDRWFARYDVEALLRLRSVVPISDGLWLTNFWLHVIEELNRNGN